MAGSVNKVILIGNLGADPEIRRLQDGRPVANFSLATSERWRERSTNEQRERTEWHRVVIFSEGLAKIAEQYLRKGSKVYLEGQLQTRSWEDQSGVKKWTTEVVLSGFNASLTMLDSMNNRPPPADNPDAYGTQKPAAAGDQRPARDELDDEIPF